MKSIFFPLLLAGILLWIPASSPVRAGPSYTPLIDMGTETYLGFQGGLYPEGSNSLPAAHAAVGNHNTIKIQALDADGIPASSGKYVMLSVGMSNTSQEFCGNSIGGSTCKEWTFMGQAASDPLVEQTELVIVNGAKEGEAAADWESPNSGNYDRIRDQLLLPLCLSEAQVQVVWVKVVNSSPSTPLPASNADAIQLLGSLGNIVRTLKVRYPNIQLVFLSSRIYAGYASTSLNPEPYAYESGFSIKWLIEAQIDQMNGGGIHPYTGDLDYDTVAPWLAWGPYLWANGILPRSDGLIWELEDFNPLDGTHPSQSGETKVGAILLDFFLDSPQTGCWFKAGHTCMGNAIFIPFGLHAAGD